MTASSTARVFDPLEAPEAISASTEVSLATAPRRVRITPDVTAIHGAEAVALVRASGFIAAIEPVASELPAGTVIEQDPPAGARLEREGVVLLRLATPRRDAAQVAPEDEADLASEKPGRVADHDDTELWFAALALSSRDTAAGTSTRRPRKPGRASIPARGHVVDPRPAPSEPVRDVTFSRRRAGVWPFAVSSVCVLTASLAALQWRRPACCSPVRCCWRCSGSGSSPQVIAARSRRILARSRVSRTLTSGHERRPAPPGGMRRVPGGPGRSPAALSRAAPAWASAQRRHPPTARPAPRTQRDRKHTGNHQRPSPPDRTARRPVSCEERRWRVPARAPLKQVRQPEPLRSERKQRGARTRAQPRAIHERIYRSERRTSHHVQGEHPGRGIAGRDNRNPPRQGGRFAPPKHPTRGRS
jgi:hypothetical protein